AANGGTLTAFGDGPDLDAYAGSLAGVQTQIVRLPRAAGANAAWHLLGAGYRARRLGADVLLLPAANRRIAAWSPVPVVAVVHDLAQLRVERKYDPLRMFYFRRILLPAFRRPAALVAISQATRNDLTTTLRLPAERVRVVYNGVNPAAYRVCDAENIRRARAAAGLAERPYLLYPARLEHPGKNHVRLLQAFARSGLAATHVLALSGADWGAEPLIRAKIDELRLSGTVRLLGFVGQLAPLLAGADAVLMLGLHEGFGLPPLEALSAGRPVCVANTGALPEVVGPFGVQCDPLSEHSIAEALRQVVSDEAIRTRCRQGGPAWADRFTWGRTAEGLLEACHAAVNRVAQKPA
ncbi:MAG TPA: glycosyltransferase family 1 protein, partial [Opitutaceae bacterium]|nr:glycosyltransferase family 1 protein [Opitutaceae bacterium]